MPTEREVTIEEFRAHLTSLPPTRRIDEVVIHHTWSPTAAQYRGIETVRGVRNYHMNVRGWSDNGYHVMIGPDGRVFLCRPLAGSGAHTNGRNAHTIGVSFIANFDSEDPTSYVGMEVGYQVVAALLRRYQLVPGNIRFHREFAPKTCPGLKLGLTAFREEVGRRLSEGDQAAVTAIVNGTTLEGEVVKLEDGKLWVWGRAIAEAADGTVEWDEQKKTATFRIGGE